MTDPCNCYPHGPYDPCTCSGSYSDGTPGCCLGNEPGCACDINWECTSSNPCPTRYAVERPWA